MQKQDSLKSAQDKVTLIGNPVRKELLEVKKDDARKKINIPSDKKMVLIYGGSGGFKKINDAMIDVVKSMIEEDVAFVYATGKRFYESFVESLNGLELKSYQK